MKTKIKNLGILFSVVCLFLGFLSMSGCGASTEYESVDQYKKGEFDPGWLVGMSEEKMYEFINHLLDIETREAGLKYFKERYVIASQNTTTTDGSSIQTPIGTVAVINNRSRDVTINIIKLADDINDQELVLLKQKLREGKTAQDIYVSWYIMKKKTEFPVLPPGKYLAFYRNGNNLVIKEEVLSIDLRVDTFKGINVSGIVNADR